jgi:hypothetical protein
MAMVVALLALAVLASASGDDRFPPNNRYDSNVYATNLRGDVLSRSYLGAPYDRDVPPISNRSLTPGPAGHYSDSGTDVRLSIRFFKVEAVNAAHATMTLKVWVRMYWVDERLSWNPADYGNLTETYYRADQTIGDEVTQIWVPDLQPYNSMQVRIPPGERISTRGRLRPGSPGTRRVVFLRWCAGLSEFARTRARARLQ